MLSSQLKRCLERRAQPAEAGLDDAIAGGRVPARADRDCAAGADARQRQCRQGVGAAG